MIIQNIKFDDRGLIPVIVQEADGGEVIALCHIDNASLMETLKTGRASFLSAALASGANEEPYRLLDIRVNQDGNSLTALIERDSSGERRPAQSLLKDAVESKASVSTGVSLIDVGSMEFGLTITNLYTLIAEREATRPEGSYTAYLFNSGLDKILKKIAEESGEVIIAAKNRSPHEIVSELSDLFFHLLVLMVERDVKLSDVHDELARRAARASQPVQD